MSQITQSVQPSSAELAYSGAGPSWNSQAEPNAHWAAVVGVGEYKGDRGL